MIPPTQNGLSSMACLSALQKCIRRALRAWARRMLKTTNRRNARARFPVTRLLILDAGRRVAIRS